ncbi:1-deoxy-D-xylulose-5-phosphate synthase N-terminal domain-containing protein, partial [Lactococcus cremoris]|uniref:1-deoxy-D-xylulose-5-phosphate synthase N-terminal domain-containing protein n=1 Tax=Lactococcus lactis subsp. cremoris TaxID=1359 RepID=UPI000AB90001
RYARKKWNIVAIIGDGALSGGLAFEGLDGAGTLNGNLIIIVNDNEMAITENHGGIYQHLADL